MLDNQWFAIAFGPAEAILRRESLPSARSTASFEGPDGRVVLFHGPSAFVEETPDAFAVAVGDTRSLSGLAGFRNAGPERHAVICVLDKRTRAVRVVTDRLNFAKVFHYKGEGNGFALTTHLTFLDQRELKFSTTGLASAIANGTEFNNHTIFEDVAVLERASVYEFHGVRHTARSYWSYGFDGTLAPGAGKEQLKEALVDAIRDQAGDQPLLLSLSGGFDSSGILGVLARYVRPRSLKTFSYIQGAPAKGTDAMVAQQMAERAGYPHSIQQAYDGDIVATIRRNAALGQGLTNFCDEIDAWHRKGQEEKGSVVLAGDECFGWADRRLVSTSDVMISVCLRKFEFAGAVIPLLDSAVAKEMTEGLASEIDEIVRRSEKSNLHDMKDLLYLEHRMQWGLLPWRRFVIGEYFEVREPLVQTPVLEVIRKLPMQDRIGKALYRKAIQELAPEVFSIPRARTGQATPDWRRELIRDRAKVAEMLKTASRLDEAIAPDVLLELLNSLERDRPAGRSWKLVVRQMVGPAATRLLRSFARPETPRSQSTQTILIRLLVLREFLSTRQR